LFFMRFFRAGGALVGLVSSLPVLATGVTLDTLRADQAALTAAKQDYRTHAATLSNSEAADFSAYIERLRERLAADCNSLRLAGVEPPGDVSCPQAVLASPPSVYIDQSSEQTPAERTDVLDAELLEGLGAFDEKLLREQARVKAQVPRAAGNGTPGGVGGTAGAEGEAGESGAAGGAAAGGATAGGATTRTGGESTAGGVERPAGSAGGAGRPATASGQPADIPDGSDDDVVARQLREAAEKETDPALKEKLWEEYRKYKQGTG
jgi:hypothetical protein